MFLPHPSDHATIQQNGKSTSILASCARICGGAKASKWYILKFVNSVHAATLVVTSKRHNFAVLVLQQLPSLSTMFTLSHSLLSIVISFLK
jgi:hypothetical protein